MSLDATTRSNITVGPPFELATYEADSLVLGYRCRFDADDKYLISVRDAWNNGIQEAFSSLPKFSWESAGGATAPRHSRSPHPAALNAAGRLGRRGRVEVKSQLNHRLTGIDMSQAANSRQIDDLSAYMRDLGRRARPPHALAAADTGAKNAALHGIADDRPMHNATG